MGQTIQVESIAVEDIALFDTDRTMTGQDGQGISPVSASEAATTIPGNLARRLFATDPSIDHVFVLSNQVTIRRPGGWSDESLQSAGAAIRDFFVYYEENRGITDASPEA